MSVELVRAARWVSAALTGLCLVIIIIFAAPLPQRKSGETIAGKAYVVDGDSLEIGRRRLRLHGLDAPELRQKCSDRDGASYACGRTAQRHLAGLIAGSPVSCTELGRDRYDRSLVACRVGEVDLNEAMVRDGWAVAYGEYRAQEKSARAGRRGLWQGDFEEPGSWRRRHAE